MNTFSSGAMVRFGWETFKKRPWFFIFVFLVVSILGGRYSYQTGSTEFHFTPEIIALLVGGAVIGVIIQTLVAMGKTNLLLKAHDNVATVSWWDLWSPHPFWRYLGASILVGVIVLIGFILLIVPGIIWGLRYMFVPYIVMERKLKPFDALAESARITHGHKWQLLGFLLVLLGVNILGLLCLLVGLLVSIPVSALAFAHAYRTLSGQASSQQAGTQTV